MANDIYDAFDCRTCMTDLGNEIELRRSSLRDQSLESRVSIPLKSIGKLFTLFLKKLDNEWWQVPSLVEWREYDSVSGSGQELEWGKSLEELSRISSEAGSASHDTLHISVADDEIKSIVFSQGDSRLAIHPAEIYRLIYGLQTLPNVQGSGILRSIFEQWEKVRREAPEKTNTQLPFLDTGKGEFQPTCLCYANFDIGGSGACFNSILPTGEVDHDNACAYCYSNINNRYQLPYKRLWSSSWTKMFDIETFIRFQKKERRFTPIVQDMRNGDTRITSGRRFKYVRIGKNIEAGHILLRNNLLVTLMHLEREGVSFILPTKSLGYDKAFEDLAKTGNSFIHYSISDEQLDVLERGAHAWGCGYDFRVRSAEEYSKAGLNVAFRVVSMIDVEPSDRVTQLVVRTQDEKKIPVLFTPMRLYIFNQRVVKQITGGLSRQEMIEKRRYANQPAITKRQHTSILLPPKIHPYYLGLEKEHPDLFGFCAHTREVEKNVVEKKDLFGGSYPVSETLDDDETIFCGACMSGLSHDRFRNEHSLEYTKGRSKFRRK